jgi:hypothetical protein
VSWRRAGWRRGSTRREASAGHSLFCGIITPQTTDEIHKPATERFSIGCLIGAHALSAADRLLTRDRGFYRRDFSGLKVLDSTA